jgi:lantibiotic modifying enzyme
MSGPTAPERLATAVHGAFDWIDAVAVDVDGGRGWCDGDTLLDDLYAGTAGVLFGCAEAAASGADVGRVATAARSRLLHLAETNPGGIDLSLFDGWAGVAVALGAWSRANHDHKAAGAAASVIASIAARVMSEPHDPLDYIDIISGDAGTLLALLADESDAARGAATVLADRLVATAEPAPVGLHWRASTTWDPLSPGFSHGTAGVAYTLAAAGRALGRRELVDVAVQGAEALLDVGDTPDGWAVPLTIPPQAHRPPVFFGWCHGPTGTIRLFVLLDQIDPQPRWSRAVDACLQALRRSRLPQRLYPGYWDNLGRCCGSAGVGQLLLDRYHATGDPALLEWCGVLAADVLDRAVPTPYGVTWSHTEHTATPPTLPPEPGLMQGAAGIAGWLARLEAAYRGAGPVDLLGVDPPWV